MDNTQLTILKRLRLFFSSIISILIFGLLLWNYFHGGVPSHHILDQKDLPAISNWWSGILLPILTWILLGRIITRIEKKGIKNNEYRQRIINILWLFSIGLIFGILLSVSFVHNYKPFLDNVLYVFLILSFIVPIFFSEFILGFVLGMTYTFGAILPTAFILIMAAIGIVIYKSIRLFINNTKIFGDKRSKNDKQ